MKITTIVFLFCLIALSQAKLHQEISEESPLVIKVMATQYYWLLDIVRISLLFSYLMTTGLFFVIPSFLLNNQEWWVIYVYEIMYLPLIRLSGAPMS